MTLLSLSISVWTKPPNPSDFTLAPSVIEKVLSVPYCEIDFTEPWLDSGGTADGKGLLLPKPLSNSKEALENSFLKF